MSSTAEDNIFSVSNMYQMASRMYSAIPYKFMKSGYSFPAWHYYIEVTRRCNLRCKMCQYIDWLENVPIREQMEGELSREEWLHVIEQIPRFSLITFTGGEPFVRKDFMELLTVASNRARTHFVSNTTMLPPDRAEALVDLAPSRLGRTGFNFAGTSIEGPGDRHDEIRKLRGAFKRSMDGIRTLVKVRDAQKKVCPLVHITTVLQEDNLDVLHHMPDVVKDCGATVLNLVTETRMHDLPDFGEVDPSIYNTEDISWPRLDRKKLTDALNKTLARAKEIGVEVRLPRVPKEEIINYYDGGIDLKDYECRNAWNTLIIGRQGNAYPCWLIKVGNVKEDSLKDIWNNATMRQFRQTCQKKLFAPCPGCCFLEHKQVRNGQQSAGHVAAQAG